MWLVLWLKTHKVGVYIHTERVMEIVRLRLNRICHC